MHWFRVLWVWLNQSEFERNRLSNDPLIYLNEYIVCRLKERKQQKVAAPLLVEIMVNKADFISGKINSTITNGMGTKLIYSTNSLQTKVKAKYTVGEGKK